MQKHAFPLCYGNEAKLDAETKKHWFIWNGTGRILRRTFEDILRYLKAKLLLELRHVVALGTSI